MLPDHIRVELEEGLLRPLVVERGVGTQRVMGLKGRDDAGVRMNWERRKLQARQWMMGGESIESIGGAVW
jgi:hypothetical protein